MTLFEYFIYTKEKSIPMLRLYDTYVEPFNRRFREHHHTAFEMSVCCSGEGIYQTNEARYSIKKGDVFFFGSNDAHCITDIFGTEDMLLTTIQFEPRFLWAYSEHDFDIKYMNVLSTESRPFPHRLEAGSEMAQIIGQSLINMKQEYLNKENGFEYMIKSELLRLLVLLIRRNSEKLENQDFSLRKTNITNLDKAMDYIDKNFSSEITLEELSEVSGMSRNYFCAVFKRLNGLSPWDYITIRRIEKAAELLKSTNDNVLEIATNCGYNSTANFNRAFKKVTGRVPKDYRK